MHDFLGYSSHSLFVFSLAFIRISGLCIVSPFFGGETVNERIRILLALFIAFVFFPTLQSSMSAVPTHVLEYLFLVLKELMVGLFIGFLVTAIFFGFQLGGRYMAIHMGLSMARMMDPFSNEQTSVIGQLLSLITLTVFVVVDGHHFILRALYSSFEYVPLAQVHFRAEILDQAVKLFNVVIDTSLRVAMPTMAGLFAVNMIFGFIARLVPKMKVFILALPAKIAIGVMIISASLPFVLLLIGRVMNSVFKDIFMIIRAF